MLAPPVRWVPDRVMVTASAAHFPHTATILRRCEALGVSDIDILRSDRLTGLRGGPERETYAAAKRTLAVVVAPPSARRPQPIPPSADFRVDLARGCPAHCQYCYLAGSLAGPPVTRVFANLDEVLAPIATHAGKGRVTSTSLDRADEGTTFEVSCYTDPLGIEAATGSLAETISRVGAGRYGPDVSLRFTAKFDDVHDLLALKHKGRTRVRLSVNSQAVARRFEGGTARTEARISALCRLADAGYPVGLTIAPVMPLPGWQHDYGQLLDQVAQALGSAARESGRRADLTVEIITHRFTEASKSTLLAWYPATKLDLDEASRSRRTSKFGAVKYVYPAPVMREMRTWFEAELHRRLPAGRLLYWT